MKIPKLSSENEEKTSELPLNPTAGLRMHPFKRLLSSWVPNPLDFGIWALLIPFTLFFTLFWLAGQSSMKLMTNSLQFWEYIIFSFATESSVFLIGIVVSLRYLRSRKLSTAFVYLYLLTYGVNIGMLHHSGTLLNPFYVSIVTWNNWTTYLTREIALLIALFLIICGTVALLIRRCEHSLVRIPLKGFVAVLVLALGVTKLSEWELFHPTAVLGNFLRTATPDKPPETNNAVEVANAPPADFATPMQTSQLRYLARNQLGVLAEALFAPENVLEEHSTAELQGLEGFLAKWNIGMGQRHYSPLNVKPFEHIIVFAHESLSLDLLSPYNKELPEGLTPFYGSPQAQQALLQNFWTISLPTQPGVTTMYNSHPNSHALINGGPDLSLIKILKQNGYHTIFLKSGSQTFANDHIVYKRFGFDEVIGLETFKKESRNQPYIDARGVMDRILFERLFEFLEKYRGQKLFIHVAGQDTHSPMPREDYADLEYPDIPATLKQLPSPEARQLLTSFFRHDFDMGNTMEALKQKGFLNEKSLIVITADHNYPQSNVLHSVPGFPVSEGYHRIPFWLISGQPLPEIDLTTPRSQLDYAPTIAHLLNLPIPQGWWGESIFEPRHTAYLAHIQDSLVYRDKGTTRVIPLSSQANEDDRMLVRLFKNAYREPQAH